MVRKEMKKTADSNQNLNKGLSCWELGPPGASNTGDAFCFEMSGSHLWSL